MNSQTLPGFEPLTLENFWNELHNQYPAAVHVFCRWIDGYKERVGWSNFMPAKQVPESVTTEIYEMRNAVSELPQKYQEKAATQANQVEKQIMEKYRSPKFHEIPLAFQAGILFQFSIENSFQFKYPLVFNPVSPETWRSDLTDFFRNYKDRAF